MPLTTTDADLFHRANFTLHKECNYGEETGNETFYEQRCVSNEYYCYQHGYYGNETTDTPPYDMGNCIGRNTTEPSELPLSEVVKENSISPAEDYFNGFVLGLTIDKNGTTRTFEEFGSIRYDMSFAFWLVTERW